MTRTYITRDLIQSLADRGLTFPEAAAETGFKDISLRNAAGRYGITLKPAQHGKGRLKVNDERILDMHKRGLTTTQAAAECGVTRDNIRKRATALGVAMGRKPNLKNDHIVAPDPPPRKPVTIWPEMAALAKRENAEMRDRWKT